jgi:hypothetical protein
MREQPQFSVRNSRVFASADHDHSLSPLSPLSQKQPQPQQQHPLPMRASVPAQTEGAASLACVHKHAGAVESLLLASILHVARARPRAEPAGTFIEVIDPQANTEAGSDLPPPQAVTAALEHCFGWRGVRLSLAAHGGNNRTPQVGNSSATLRGVAAAADLGPRIDFVALNTDRVLSFLLGGADAGAGGGDGGGAGGGGGGGAGGGVGTSALAASLGASDPTVHSLLIHWRGHDEGPSSMWTRCTGCQVTSGFGPHLLARAGGGGGTKGAISSAAPRLFYDRRLSLRHSEIRFFVEVGTCYATPSSPGAKSCFREACEMFPRWATTVCRGAKAKQYCPSVESSCRTRLGAET